VTGSHPGAPITGQGEWHNLDMLHLVTVYHPDQIQVVDSNRSEQEEQARRMLGQQEVIAHLRAVHPDWSVDEVFAHIGRMNPDFLKD
jgi:hypothetical protein